MQMKLSAANHQQILLGGSVLLPSGPKAVPTKLAAHSREYTMSKARNGVLILLGLVVLGVLAWVTLKPAPSPAATLINRILFIAILAAGTALVVHTRRAGSSLPVATVASAAGLFFLAVAVLFIGHLGGVVSLLLDSTLSTPYDFRFFSLLLLGVVGLAPAVQGLRVWPGLARSEKSCWRRALRACLLLLAINVPLIPLQDFAIAFSIAGTAVLASLWTAQAHFEAQ